MTTIRASSAISMVCECPYTGKTQEIKGNEENEEKRRKKLRKEINDTKEDLIITRKVLVDTRRKLAMFQRILSLELGWITNPYVKIQTNWKERVREKSYLKSGVVHLIDYLRECDPQYIEDLPVHPMKLSTSTEDLLSAKQEVVLKGLYHNYTVFRSGNEKLAGASLSDYLKLKKDYEMQLYGNKILDQEIALTKQKIADLQKQFLEDKFLIDFISKQHFKIKGTFSSDNSEEKAPKKDRAGIDSKDAEAEKFKKMWERSRKEKLKLSAVLQSLKKKLEFADQKIIRAENVCAQNIITCTDFANKMRKQVLLTKVGPKQKEEFGKFSLIQFRSERSQLVAAESENLYLRNFLHKIILSKSNNLKHFQNSLTSTAGKYHDILEDIRTKAAPPPAPIEIEVKPAKAKKKKT